MCILLLNGLSQQYELFCIGSFAPLFCIFKDILSICSISHWVKDAVWPYMFGFVCIFSYSIIIYFEVLLFGAHAFGLLYSLNELTTFIIMKWPSLSFLIFLVLKYIVSEIATAIFALFSLMLMCDTSFFYSINLYPLLSLYLK